LNGAVDQLFLAEQTRQDVKLLNDLPASLDLLQQQDGGAAVPDPALQELRQSAEAEFDAREQSLTQTRERLDSEARAAAGELAEARRVLEQITRDLSAIQRLNPLGRSEAHRLALARIERLEEQLAARHNEQD